MSLLRPISPGLEAAVTADIAEVKAELKADIAGLEAAVTADIAEVKAELKADIAEVRTEIAEVKAELKADIAEVKAELKADIAEVRTEIAEVEDGNRRVEGRVESRHRGHIQAALAGSAGHRDRRRGDCEIVVRDRLWRAQRLIPYMRPKR